MASSGVIMHCQPAARSRFARPALRLSVLLFLPLPLLPPFTVLVPPSPLVDAAAVAVLEGLAFLLPGMDGSSARLWGEGVQATAVEEDDGGSEASSGVFVHEHILGLQVCVNDLALPVQKVEAITDFTSHAAHELNGNAGVVIGLDQVQQVVAQRLKGHAHIWRGGLDSGITSEGSVRHTYVCHWGHSA